MVDNVGIAVGIFCLLLLVFVIEHYFTIRILAQSGIPEVLRDKYEMNIVTVTG
jgi:hypothetical protein